VNSSVKVAPIERLPTSLLAVAVGTLNGKVPTSLLGLDDALDGALGRAIAQGDLTGERDSVQVFYGAKGPKRVMLIGMGRLGEITRGAVRRGSHGRDARGHRRRNGAVQARDPASLSRHDD